jgi:hypothetical protein
MSELRQSLCSPVNAIFVAAEKLLEAVDLHRAGDHAGVAQRIRDADCDAVRAYTEKAWGKGSAARNELLEVAYAPAHLAIAERPRPRMPGILTRKKALARDGHHCRFCGVPVIDPMVRRNLSVMYPDAVRWGSTNSSQHAAFQCMWLQFDHILPNSRGGDSSFDNIVIACAACNFGRMGATLEEARLRNPLHFDPPISWNHHHAWNGLEYFSQHPARKAKDFR